MQQLASAATHTLHYFPGQHLLVLRWLLDADLPTSQPAYEQLLAAALRLSCGRWLVDGRRQELLDPASVGWLVHTFLPAATARLAPQPLRLAGLAPPARLQLLEATTPQEIAQVLSPDQPFATRLFSTEAEALAWLGP